MGRNHALERRVLTTHRRGIVHEAQWHLAARRAQQLVQQHRVVRIAHVGALAARAKPGPLGHILALQQVARGHLHHALHVGHADP